MTVLHQSEAPVRGRTGFSKIVGLLASVPSISRPNFRAACLRKIVWELFFRTGTLATQASRYDSGSVWMVNSKYGKLVLLLLFVAEIFCTYPTTTLSSILFHSTLCSLPLLKKPNDATSSCLLFIGICRIEMQINISM